MPTKTITLVTGNPHKLKELKELAPSGMKLAYRSVDLKEIQSLNLHEITED